MASASAVYASSGALPHPHARLASGWWLAIAGRESNPLDFSERFLSSTSDFPFPRLILARRKVRREGGQGGFEIRTFIAIAGATEGCAGELWCYVPIPIFAVGCTVAVMRLR